MNPTSKARALTYATSAVIGGAVLLNMLGLADYDAAAGTFDLHPISVYALAGLLAPVFSAALAPVALVQGWGGKQ